MLRQNTEIDFNPDEQALLDWLQARIRPDGALCVSDSKLIHVLGLKDESQRFFAAKMRLVAAGVISMYVDGLGRQILVMNMPATKAVRSNRYVFLVVPLELTHSIRKQVKRYRLEQLKKKKSPVAAVAPKEGEAAPASPSQLVEQEQPEVSPPMAPVSNSKTLTLFERSGIDRSKLPTKLPAEEPKPSAVDAASRRPPLNPAKIHAAVQKRLGVKLRHGPHVEEPLRPPLKVANS